MTSPCPPWCQGNHRDRGFHKSGHEQIPIASAGIRAAAYAAQRKGGRPWVTVCASPALLEFDEPDEARDLAGLIELLATATRRQHLDLAAQIRIGADIVDGPGPGQ